MTLPLWGFLAMTLQQSVPFQVFREEVLDVYRAGMCKATVAKMTQVLDEFAEICESTADVNLHSISLWLDGCRARSVMTRRSLLSSFRAACQYGSERGYCDNPFLSWTMDQRLPAPDPEDLDRPHLCRSGAEISRLLRRACAEAATGPWRARRTKTLVYLAAYTGARARELLGAQTRDVDLPAGTFAIRPNSRRDLKTRPSRRVLPLHPELADALRIWLPDTGSAWLLPQRCGRGPWYHGGPGYRPLDCVQQLGERCAVDGLTLASFRHTFATSAEGWGWSELAIMRWLGHSRPTTQRWYRPRPVPELLTRAAELIRY